MKLIKSNLREHFLLIVICFFYFMAVFALDGLTDSKIMGDLNFYYFIINNPVYFTYNRSNNMLPTHDTNNTHSFCF